ncbi:MAG: Response regulator receiver protein [Candidatus Magasanikbacteria bacterium GW2011_GWA2_37_8]|uniref:Response regulator receiver protein n=1 Tax=Candidatus Magasanikbacteria bacterium GW2011_GWA2_37_8 TaxID=1619036 RepID=A0A0G0HED5_9BACT|nr:MAG: Response regulator receiver protein [Candidatus Magasanikbacteria bacterium GW2011_GWA2_37_8]
MAKRKKTILIVEDDEILLRALYLNFEDLNFTLASATDGEMAVVVTQRVMPDLILLDLLIPKMDGFRVIEVLKSDPKTKNIPIIVLSNLGSEADIKRAKISGALDYFVKANTKLEELKEKVTNYLK